MDFSFLRRPLSGGNLFKTLATVLGGAALARDPGQSLGAVFGGLNAYQTARQGMLDREYADAVSAWQREDVARRWQAEQEAKAAAAAATQEYRDRTLAETERYHRAQEGRAAQDRNARLGQTLLNAIGPNDPRTVDALRAGGMGFLPPVGSSPLGFVPAAPGAPTAYGGPVEYDPGSVFGSRAASTAGVIARTRGTDLDNTFKERTMEPRIAHQEMLPRLDAANLQGIKTRTARAAGEEGRARALHPGKVEQQRLENEMLRTGRIPMVQAQLEGQRIRNRFLPAQLGANLAGTEARTEATRLGAAARLDDSVNVPTGANAAIAAGATAREGQDFKQAGCARFVTATLKGAGVSIRGSENAAELERQVRSVGGVKVESNPKNFRPGDIIFMPGSGRSGRHVMVVDSKGRILGNPGTATRTRVQVQGGGPGMVAYRLPEGTVKGRPAKPVTAAKPKALTQAQRATSSARASNVDPTTYKRLKAAGFTDGPQMLESFNWWDKNSPNLFKKRYSSGQITSISADPNHKDYQKFIQDQQEWAAKNVGGGGVPSEDPEVAAILNGIR